MVSRRSELTNGRIRAGAVTYLNARPLVISLPQFAPQVEVVVDLPSRLADALADCTWVIGTTRRKGKQREGVVDPRQMAAEITEIIQQNKVAVVFGPEDRGLTNRDLDLCQRLVAIPAHEEYGSLNLAQAVMIICYEV